MGWRPAPERRRPLHQHVTRDINEINQ
jgi:hypothetical protein